jgi:uncharacterized membrane protein YhaH (DUF805 family)
MNWFLSVLRNYAKINGRARRKEYWYFALFYFIFAILILLVSIFLRAQFLYFFYVLALIIPSFAVGVRRMHDVDKSGWYLLIPIYSLILCCTNGTEGPNQYGPDPKRPEFEDFLNEDKSADLLN